MRQVMILVILIFSCPAWSADREYDFDYDSKNDMRGAWMMCATTGFKGGECSKVLRRCWQRPMIYLKRHNTHYHTKTKCRALPTFNMSGIDVDNALKTARKMVGVK